VNRTAPRQASARTNSRKNQSTTSPRRDFHSEKNSVLLNRAGKNDNEFRRGKDSSADSAKNQSQYTFSDAVGLAALNAGVREQLDTADPHCPLTAISYEDELKLKLDAVKAFWKVGHLPEALVREIIPSPMGRPCRMTSKRRVVITKNGRVRFTMGYTGMNRKETIESPIEPAMHGELYQWLHSILVSAPYAPLARHLNFIVIRGNYESITLILNLFRLDAPTVRKVKQLAERVQAECPSVRSMFMFVDESRSEFYLESKATTHPFRKVFGPEMMDITVNDGKFLFPPGAFCQVNGSILDRFVGEAEKLLKPDENSVLYDMYCGFGLFGIAAGSRAGRVIGMDFNGPAIQAAMGNAAHIAPNRSIRFIAGAVTANAVMDKIPPRDEEDGSTELFLLDPPRSGIAANVIAAIAERKPKRVLHIFCSADEVAKSVNDWRHNGYIPVQARVFDMFPGTPNVETMILLERKAEQPREPRAKFSTARKSGRSERIEKAPGVSHRADRRRKRGIPEHNDNQHRGRSGFPASKRSGGKRPPRGQF